MNNTDLKNKITNAKHPVAFTGSMISELSGFPDLEEKFFDYKLAEILSINFFYSHTKIFYKTFLQLLNATDVAPNYIHNTLCKLNFTIITENFDSLHQKSGSSNTIELNNNLKYLSCENCNYEIESKTALSDIDKNNLLSNVRCPHCKNILKPTLILFGEKTNKLHIALNEIYKSDLLIIIGNKLKYYPFNILPIKANNANCPIIILQDDYSIFN